MIKNFQDFILLTGEGIVIDFVNGNFVIENKNFVEGEKTDKKYQGIGVSLELACENFIHSWKRSLYQLKLSEDEIEQLRWHSSH